MTKSQNLKSLTLKSKIFNFDKIWPKIKIPPRSFIITLRFHQNSKVKIFQNLSQYGRTILTRFFQNFEVDIKITKIPKIGSNHQNFEVAANVINFMAELQMFFALWFIEQLCFFVSAKNIWRLSAMKLRNFWFAVLVLGATKKIRDAEIQPRTRTICDKRMFLDKIWWLCENLVIFELFRMLTNFDAIFGAIFVRKIKNESLNLKTNLRRWARDRVGFGF